MESKLILIDGNAIIHRAYHAMPALTTPMGQPIGAVQGFINMLLKVIEDMEPTHIAVAWDRPEPTFRNKLFKEYQSQRPEVDKELVSQFDKVRAAMSAFDIIQYDKKGYEADDIIGTLSRRAVNDNKFVFDEVIIVTGDKDQLQLVDDKHNIKVYLPLKGLSVGQLLDSNAVKEKLGVRPDQVVDLKAFMGDPSDNYPGVFGVGPKTAVSLINEFGGYQETYEWLEKKDVKSDSIRESVIKKLIEGKETGDISYKLARIVTDVDITFEPDAMNRWSIGNDKTIKLFKSYGFRSLTSRIEEIRDAKEAEKQGQLF